MGATGVGATGVAYDDDGLEDGVVKGVASVFVKIGGVGPLLGKDVGLLVVPGPPPPPSFSQGLNSWSLFCS